MSFDPANYKELKVAETEIPGLFDIDLAVFGDNRGWFKENYQRQKLEALGLPHFDPVQNNFSFNADAGTTRGLHLEPWVKYVTVANGSVLGAWIDLRDGPTFGKTITIEINPGKAVFVPLGVANGYQTLEPNVTYTYLVSAHWSPDAKYTFVNAFDPAVGIDWPYSQDKAVFSDKDAAHPLLRDVKPLRVEDLA